ncbi:PREDICTED: endosialin-like [Thamnophis sirtalis]|uniref:Endosialin-like n=1 Tax=Thamnophis sirtalis TaxID=35019 RepID=A0A6I9YL84_9SAUR|nr:PREDICTED: endosialin-like [Thamnophis sirtalis]
MLAPRLPLGPAGLLLLLFPLPAQPDPEASCDPDGCYALYPQPRSFLEAWRACRELGGNLATLKRAEEAAQVSQLLAGSRRQPGPPRLFWIGLQRQPRQCFPQRPLRGFSWVTGEQETAYSNWAGASAAVGAPGAAGCAAPRCVALDDRDFQWLEGSCAGPVDGYLCRFVFRGMCAGLEEEGGDDGGGISISYAAPFGRLAAPAAVGAPPRFVPFGTVASVGCPGGASLSLLCMQKEDGRVGWSKSPPLCRAGPSGGSGVASSASAASWCEGDNGGCQQLCLDEGSGYACECHAGYLLLPDGHSCAANDPCRRRPCQFDCVAEEDGTDGYSCRCPAGYELASDGHQCEDLDECLDAPCEHQCENTEGSFLCRCHLGFSPSEEEPGQCVDTDECQIPGVCQQMCVNYVGGFECYCTEGFDLEADGISCSPVDALDGPDATPPEAWHDPFHIRFTTREADDLSEPPVRFSLFRDGEAGSSSDSAASFLSVPDRLVFPPPVPATAAPEFDSAWDSRVSPLEQSFSSPGHPEVLHSTPEASDPPPATSDVGSLPLGVTGTLLPTSEVPAEPLTTPPSDEKAEDPVVGGVRAPLLPTSAAPSPASGEGRPRKDDRWLLVALLVPISVFLVIMLALGIVYCTRCGAQVKSRSVTQCYRWVINTSEKTAPTSSSSSSRPCQPATCRTSV